VSAPADCKMCAYWGEPCGEHQPIRDLDDMDMIERDILVYGQAYVAVRP
jgi:hypothetical protein